jgi:carbonic anhydrase/acetyltransferase-like protein (isoleucine patch superfamily)
MLLARNGQTPHIDNAARIAPSAVIVGNVRVGPRSYVDHNVVIESAGPPIVIGEETVVFAGAVIRSVGGRSRPAFPVKVAKRTLILPLCALTACRIGSNCYMAAAAIALQGAILGDHVRVGAAAIVHAATVLPDRARVGMRHIAAPSPDGFLSTGDVELAREAVSGADFFETAFGLAGEDQVRLHDQVMSALLDETHHWHDEPIP